MTRRHDALMPLTHDHHHVLAKARRLKEAAAKGTPEDLWRAGQDFVDFFDSEGLLHFREEEEEIVPLFGDALPPEAVKMLEDHVILRESVRALAHETNVATVSPETALEIADRFVEHVRFEEKVLFPLVEREVTEDRLRSISLAERDRTNPSA